MPFIIVDLDSSLSNDSHRSNQKPTHSKDQASWDRYHALLHLDPVNWYIRDLINDFGRRHPEAKIILLTGRYGEQVRLATEKWLSLVVERYDLLITKSQSELALTNSEFKHVAFERYLKSTGQVCSDCILAIEDLPAIVKLWKSYGIPVLQVHQKEMVL